jgi:hypothetical protein
MTFGYIFLTLWYCTILYLSSLTAARDRLESLCIYTVTTGPLVTFFITLCGLHCYCFSCNCLATFFSCCSVALWLVGLDRPFQPNVFVNVESPYDGCDRIPKWRTVQQAVGGPPAPYLAVPTSPSGAPSSKPSAPPQLHT